MAKLTKAQEFAKAWREVEIDESLLTFEAFRAKHSGVQQPAKLMWIDASSGDGMVQLEDGTILSAHFSVIKSVDKNGYTWPTPLDQERLAGLGYNVPCIVTPYISYGANMCETIYIPTLK